MLSHVLAVASKEIVDGLRDVRSVVAALVYALMGPVVVGLVAFATRSTAKSAAEGTMLGGMMAVFTLVSAFVGGMSVAMDTVAGERERRSLLPLLLNPVPRLDLLAGKWLAVCFFAAAGMAINVGGFALVFARIGLLPAHGWLLAAPLLALALLPLPLFAASLQLLFSTECRGVKEAQTYLSLIVFLPMGVGMFLIFAPAAAQSWVRFLPLAGQQLQLEAFMKAGGSAPLEAVAAGCLTAAASVALLMACSRRLQRDQIVYGS